MYVSFVSFLPVRFLTLTLTRSFIFALYAGTVTGFSDAPVARVTISCRFSANATLTVSFPSAAMSAGGAIVNLPSAPTVNVPVFVFPSLSVYS